MNLSTIKVKRVKSNEVTIYIKVAQCIADAMKPSNPMLETSTGWRDELNNGLKYYYNSPDFNRSYIMSFSSYGGSLLNAGRGAILRTVGIEKGITVKIQALYSKDELEMYCRELGNGIKELYNQVIKPVEVTTIVKV